MSSSWSIGGVAGTLAVVTKRMVFWFMRFGVVFGTIFVLQVSFPFSLLVSNNKSGIFFSVCYVLIGYLRCPGFRSFGIPDSCSPSHA